VCTYGIQYDYFPSDETHPLRPITDYGCNKAGADNVFLEAYYREKFPVVIMKPSTTYGPVQGMVRQVCWDFSWIDRVNKGKPILVCGDGNALHQYLHVDDAAKAFLNVPGFDICAEIFAHHVYYSAAKLFRDVPEFQPQISLEKGMTQVFEVMEREDRIPNSDLITWEDRIIARQKSILS
jgi:hypothetical protein